MLLPIRRALLSVTDKTGLADFAQSLAAAGVALYSTGGTRKHLEEAGLAVTDIAEYTGFPEMLDGRLKTLHPKVFGGILGRHDRADDQKSLAEHGILSFELVVVNLYAFEQTIAKPGVTLAEAKEQIDIGGPSLIRAAAKNHAFAAIATDAKQYPEIAAELKASGGLSLDLRRRLAAAAFARTAEYDRAIADYFARETSPATKTGDPLPAALDLRFDKESDLRYGENPHQAAALYRPIGAAAKGRVELKQLHGKEISYNNLLDVDAAWALTRLLAKPAAVVIKHNNPCGAAEGTTLAAATRAALDGDPVSAFGSVIALSAPVDAAAAEVLVEPGRFIEVLVAPSFSDEAVKLLTTVPKWKNNVRLLAVANANQSPAPISYRVIDSGLLVQEADVVDDPEAEWKTVTTHQASDQLLADLRFAWKVVRQVKSNAIVVARDRAVTGVGAGQMSRIDSVEIALAKSGERVRGAVLASDAFFPFPDSVHKAAAAGIAAIIQPGGSVKDAESIAAANELGLAMIFTGRRHFRH